MITKIISGGQSGVDRAALDFAIAHNIMHGGACPKGRIAEDGRIANHYRLTEVGNDETQLEHNLLLRTIENIKNSDGTLVIIPKLPVSAEIKDGTLDTIEQAQNLHKPLFLLELRNINSDNFQLWLEQNAIQALNIAGPRQSTFPNSYHQTLTALKQLLI